MRAQVAQDTAAQVPKVKSKPWWRSAGAIVAYLALAFILWESYVELAGVPAYMLPSPLLVVQELVGIAGDGSLWPNLAYTLRNIVVGLLSGIVIGIALGYALHSSRWIRRILNPYIVVLQAAPKIALAPLLVLWFGLGLPSQLTLIILLAFFPMMMAMLLGLNSIPEDVHTLSRLLNLSWWQRFKIVQLPGAVPSLTAGAKLAVVDAMTGAFLAEYISAQQGLGYLMVLGNTTYNIPLLMAAILTTVAVGLVGYALVASVEKRLLKWRN